MGFLSYIEQCVNELYENGFEEIIDEISNNKNLVKYSATEMMTILAETVSLAYQNSYDDKFSNDVNELSNFLLENEKMDNIRSSFDSAFLFGLALVNIGLSYVNLDMYASEAVNKSIANNDLEDNIFNQLAELNISFLDKKDIDNINKYLNDKKSVKKAKEKEKDIDIKEKVLRGYGTVDDIFQFIVKYGTDYNKAINAMYDSDTLQKVSIKLNVKDKLEQNKEYTSKDTPLPKKNNDCILSILNDLLNN